MFFARRPNDIAGEPKNCKRWTVKCVNEMSEVRANEVNRFYRTNSLQMNGRKAMKSMTNCVA